MKKVTTISLLLIVMLLSCANNSTDSGIVYDHLIGTAEELVALATHVHEGQTGAAGVLTCNVKLTADITMNRGVTFKGIPEFSGTFDGGGKTITGMKITGDAGFDAALILRLEAGGVVKNLTMSGATVTATAIPGTSATLPAGGIAGYNSDTITASFWLCWR